MAEAKVIYEHAQSGLRCGDKVKIKLNGKMRQDQIQGFSRARIFMNQHVSEIAVLKEYGCVPVENLRKID